ncbi:MAG: ABC transporter ATP-binding protein [Syntrophales bacterium]|nr:ABC transporter ATP-binding protein [Syntrophales bacterium]
MSLKLLFQRMRRGFSFVRAYRSAIFAILVLAFAVAGLNALEPLILKYLFDELGGRLSAVPLMTGLALLLGLIAAREGASSLSNYMTWKTRLGIHYLLLEAAVGKLQKLPVSFHRNETVGAITTKLDRGIQGFLGAVTEIAFNALPALLFLAISIYIMSSLDMFLTAVVLVFTPLPVVITALASSEHIRRERTLMDRWIRIYSRFNEVLSGIVTVKSFAMEDEEKKRFLDGVSDANRIVVRGVGIDTGIGASQNLITALARVTAIAAGAVLMMRGQITLGTLIAFLGYLGGLFGPVQGISNILRTVRTASVSLEAVLSILDAPDMVEDRPNAKPIGSLRGDVKFEKVRFSYDPLQKPVLDRIDLTVRPGEMIALVGPSGAGKSTMMALIQRLYDPTDGCIRVDGTDVRDVTQQSLRKQIGIVLQEALLFNDTARNNIAYGKPNADMDEIISVAKIANAHEFILRMPQGYETVLGERGNRLSAGEKQRIAIARALLKNPPILILDEATSALDTRTEALVQEALEKLFHGRTTFVIAHRLSTVVSADRILVLKDGRIIEEGRHEKLMSRKGFYASMVFQQAKGMFPSAQGAFNLPLVDGTGKPVTFN